MVKKELEQKVKTLLGGYITAELEKLNNKEVKSVKLQNVSLATLEEHLDYDHDSLEFNGWQGDYWCSNGKYSISGCMYDATATITLKEDN